MNLGLNPYFGNRQRPKYSRRAIPFFNLNRSIFLLKFASMRPLLVFALGLSVIAQTSILDKPIKKQNTSSLKANNAKSEKQKKPSATGNDSAAPNEPAATRQENGNADPPDDRVYKVEVKKVPPDYWMRVYVIVNGLIAAFGLGTLWFVRHQRNVMKEQLTEIRNAGTQTERLISQAAAQAAALTTAATAADKSAQTAKDTIEAMNKSAHLEQRAWIGIVDAEFLGLHLGGRLEVKVKTKNTGRTPAKRVACSIDVTPVKQGDTPVFVFTDPTGGKSNAVVFPDTEYYTSGFLDFTNENFVRIRDGGIIIWVHGKLMYQDIFNRQHWLKFCFFMEPANKRLAFHSEHNEIDNGSED